MPTAATARPPGISHGRANRSERIPNAGWMIDEPIVENSTSAPSAAYE